MVYTTYLDQRVSVWVPMDAKQQEPLPLLIITVVGVQNLTRTRVLVKILNV